MKLERPGPKVGRVPQRPAGRRRKQGTFRVCWERKEWQVLALS